MRERLTASLGAEAASQLFAGTFHSLCYRILWRSFFLLKNTGRTDGWNLYDQDASQSVIYKLVKVAHPEWKSGEARELAKQVQSRISRVKNALGSWHDLSSADAVFQYYVTEITNGDSLTPGQQASADDLATWFDLYEQAMRAANAFDFDDLLGYTTALLRNDEELRTRLKRRWRHVLVDEFQDTNSPQYELVKLLAAPEVAKFPTNFASGMDGDPATIDFNSQAQQGNIERPLPPGHVFAVGDPDQAIYGWRGADVRNMRHQFAQDFPDGVVYRLRDNYRSTRSILSAAQAVISRNEDIDRAELRSRRASGVPIQVQRVEDAYEEAEHIAVEISAVLKKKICRDRDIAVLFRTHKQASLVEQQLVRYGIPYVLVGGVSFWRRVEIQDILAYLRLALTLDDDVALSRVINVPKRGVGDASLAKLNAAAETAGTTLSRLLWNPQEILLDIENSNLDAGSSEMSSSTFYDTEASFDAEISPPFEPSPVVKAVLSRKTAAAVEALRNAVVEMRHALATLPLAEALQKIVKAVDYIEHVKKGGCGGKEEDIEDRLLRLRQLVAVAEDYKPGQAAGTAALEAAFAALDDEDNNPDNGTGRVGSNKSIEDLLASLSASSSPYNNSIGGGSGAAAIITPDVRLAIARAFLDEAALYSGADEGQDVDGVRLMTMHAAKGLEFEIVFVPGCVEGLVPLFDPERGDTDKDLEEETRLFFVSMTRAKRELRLVHTKVHAHHGMANRRYNKPSRYLRDVLQSGHAEGDGGFKNERDPPSSFYRRTDRFAKVDNSNSPWRSKSRSSGGSSGSSTGHKKGQQLAAPMQFGPKGKTSSGVAQDVGGSSAATQPAASVTAAQRMQQRRSSRR